MPLSKFSVRLDNPVDFVLVAVQLNSCGYLDESTTLALVRSPFNLTLKSVLGEPKAWMALQGLAHLSKVEKLDVLFFFFEYTGFTLGLELSVLKYWLDNHYWQAYCLATKNGKLLQELKNQEGAPTPMPLLNSLANGGGTLSPEVFCLSSGSSQSTVACSSQLIVDEMQSSSLESDHGSSLFDDIYTHELGRKKPAQVIRHRGMHKSGALPGFVKTTSKNGKAQPSVDGSAQFKSKINTNFVAADKKRKAEQAASESQIKKNKTSEESQNADNEAGANNNNMQLD